MRPADVLNAHADLVRRFHDEEFAQVLIGSLARAHATELMDGGDPEVIRAVREQTVPIYNALSAHTENAYDFQVTAEMTQVVQWVAAGLGELERADLGIVPRPYGFVRLDAPLRVMDRHGREMLVNWLVWGPIHSRAGRHTPKALEGGHAGTHYLGFNDIVDSPDEVTLDILEEEHNDPNLDPERLRFVMEHVGRWGFVHYDAIWRDQRLGPAQIDPDQVTSPADLPASNLDRLIYALWLVLGQTIAAQTLTRVDRATEKRMRRMNLPGEVTVITLRRKRADPDREREPGSVEWQHSWIVAGHPRWQACGPRWSDRRLIWINDQFRDPGGGKPLKQSTKLYRLAH